MSTKLTPELQQTVEAQHGCATIDADGQSYVVMRSELYRELLGIGSEAEYEASLQAVREGWEDVQSGRTVSLDRFFQEFDRKHGIPG
jgi:hypothetical protein